MKQTKSALWFLSAAAGIFLTACASDKPAPDDPEAKAWTPAIRASCPGWQPLAIMPAGNPEYSALFSKKVPNEQTLAQNMPETEEDAVRFGNGNSEVKPQNDEKPLRNTDTKDAAADTKDAAADAACSGIADPEDEGIPAFVLISMECPDGVKDVYYVNGKECPDISAFIVSFARKAKGGDPVVMIYAADAHVTCEKADALIDECAKAGLKRYRFMSYRELGLPEKTAGDVRSEPRKTGKSYRADESAPAEKYVVRKGDTLSSIARKKYGSANRWDILYQSNRAVLKDNPDIIRIGAVLRIPAIITEEK